MRFVLKAVDAAHQVVAVELEAEDDLTARDIAIRRGYSVLTVDRIGVLSANPVRGKQSFATTLFTIELLALLEAGLNVVEALQALAEKEPEGESRRVLNDLLGALHRGESLSQAVARFPRAFSPLYVATVKSSERTGDLKEALSRYVAYEEELDRVRKKVFSALLYPAILVVVATLVLAFLLLYVVPRFARVYEDISTQLPFFSAVLLSVGRWIGNNGVLAAILIGCGLAGALYALTKEQVRTAVTRQVWRIPALGIRMHIYQLARFYRTAGMLLVAGIPAVRSFEMAGELLPPALRAQLAGATVRLSEGRSISDALTLAGLATPVATRMMAVGERSGRMGELMDRIARFYDNETARFIDAFTRVFEPVLMAVLGLAVGMVIVLMYMPIFELAGSIH